MATSIVRGRYLIARPDRVIDDGALFQRDGAIEATGRFDDIRRRYDADEVIGGPGYVVMPGLVNAHHHGRGTGAFLGGLADDALERWLLGIPAARPGLDGRLGALVSALRMLRSGTTTVLHNHLGPGVLDAVGGYAVSGMRVAFSSAYIERAFYAYDDDAFLASLPSGWPGRRGPRSAAPRPGTTTISLWSTSLPRRRRPWAPAPASSSVLSASIGPPTSFSGGAVTRRRGAAPVSTCTCWRPPYQRAADQSLYGKSAVEHLDRLGVLGPDVSFAHGVWSARKISPCWAAAGVRSATAQARTSGSATAARPCRRCSGPGCLWPSAPTALP